MADGALLSPTSLSAVCVSPLQDGSQSAPISAFKNRGHMERGADETLNTSLFFAPAGPWVRARHSQSRECKFHLVFGLSRLQHSTTEACALRSNPVLVLFRQPPDRVAKHSRITCAQKPNLPCDPTNIQRSGVRAGTKGAIIDEWGPLTETGGGSRAGNLMPRTTCSFLPPRPTTQAILRHAAGPSQPRKFDDEQPENLRDNPIRFWPQSPI